MIRRIKQSTQSRNPAWLAHLYTALGAGAALGATLAVFEGRFRRGVSLAGRSRSSSTPPTAGWRGRCA
jgi:hypothetical protein